jgi:hypothetical protein
MEMACDLSKPPYMGDLPGRAENVIRAQQREIERLTQAVTSKEQAYLDLRKHYGDRVSELQDMQEAVDLRERALQSIVGIYIAGEQEQRNALAYAEGFIGASLREDKKHDVRTGDNNTQDASARAGTGCRRTHAAA